MKPFSLSSRRVFLGQLFGGAVTFGAMSGDARAKHSRPESASGNKKFVPVMLTPFTHSLDVDFDGLSRLVDFYLACGARGFFANCASSEMYALTNDERIAIVSHVVKRVAGKYPIVATGSFGDTIEERAEFTRRMYDTGIDAVILITSHFASPDEGDDVLLRNLEKYLSLTGSIPLGTYECPSPYKRLLTPEALRSLVSTRRFVYHKDTALDLEKIRPKLDVIRGSALEFYDAHTPNTLYSLRMGAKGMSCIAGNFYPEVFAWMCSHFSLPERHDDVEWLQSELTRADRIISSGYSLSAKYFLKQRGLDINVNSRRKRAPLTPEECKGLNKLSEDLRFWHDRLGITVPDFKP